jgi:subtilisin family serine protease
VRRVGILAAAVLGLGATSAEAAWHEVRVATPVGSAQRAALDRAGAEAVQPGHGGRYVAWLDAAAARRLARDPQVRAVRAIAAREKVAGPLRDAVRARRVVVLRRGAAGRVRVLAERLTGGAALRLARRADVLHVGLAPTGLRPEDEGSAQLVAAGEPVPGYEAFLAERGLSGAGVGVAIVDTGVDARHPDLAGRVTKPADYGAVEEPIDSGGHGTHVAGIVAGNASAFADQGRVRDGAGLLYGLGIAPGASLVDLNGIGTFSESWPPAYGFDTITRDALGAGAAIWNGSWTTGEGTGVGYTQSARTLDALVRDGDPSTPAAEPFTMVLSAGNSGGPEKRITAPKEAKNLISVAASNGARGGDPEAIASFSSRGPALDGRIVPTVTAPGATIASARTLPFSQSCSTPIANPAQPLAAVYATCSGTSMASPHVAGAVALLTEQHRRAAGEDPSPALSKALLAGTARDLGEPDVPNAAEGFGRVDLAALLDAARRAALVDQDVVLSEPGQAHAVEVAGDGRPLRVTLAWTDVPAAPAPQSAAPVLVNDLDLLVTAPDGTTYRGNALAFGESVAGGQADRINNIEQVRLPAAAAGTWRIAVRAASLPGDGVPTAGDATDQDFALVATRG